MLLKGVLCFGDDAAFTVDCTIADISEKGARVRVGAGTTLPAELYLVHLRDRKAFESTVAWIRGEFVGLKFVAEHDLDNPETAELKVLRQHCVEHELR